MNKTQRKTLNRILSDNTSGSTEILHSLNKFLLKNGSDKKLISTSVSEAKRILEKFAAVTNYLNEIKKILKNQDYANLKKYLSEFESSEKLKNEKIFNKIYNKIPNTNSILTISKSGTLLNVFKLWHKKKRSLKIVVLESRPAKEGKFMAKELLKTGIKVEFITDAMAALLIPTVDVVIIGADQILKNRNVVNKTGSLSLALFCKYFSKPIYVLADKSKCTNRINYRGESDSSESVWKYIHPKLKINNILFEEIKNSLITEIITD